MVIAVDGGNRGEPGESFDCEGKKDDEVAAERELLAEPLARSVRLAGEQRGQPEVSAQEHPDEGIAERARGRRRTGGELHRIAIAAHAQRRVGRAGE